MMNIKGKITQVLPVQSGEGKKGQWKRQQIIVEIPGPYPKNICVSVWGTLINDAILIVGNNLDISIDIESKEFNGKWYTDIKAWKLSSVEQNSNETPISIDKLDNSSSTNDYNSNIFPEDFDKLPF